MVHVLQFMEVGWPPQVYTCKLEDKWFDIKAIKSLQVDVYQLSNMSAQMNFVPIDQSTLFVSNIMFWFEMFELQKITIVIEQWMKRNV